MKKLITVCGVAILVSGLLSSCAAPIFFETSQPSFKEPQYQFKNRFIGEYFDPIDSMGLIISEKSVRADPYYFGESRQDTIFSISEKNILKYYKKRYLLNYKFEEGDWGIHIMDLKGDQLTFYCFNIPDDISSLKNFGTVREVRNECGETVKMVVNPTRKGFAKLFADENLESLVVYQKVKKTD
ncbi:MAG: hypothetical protein ABJG47_17300 [Ekhidna sp.]